MPEALSTQAGSSNINAISRLSDIEADYDTFIVDIWGVMHDGDKAFPKALQSLAQLKKANKTIAFLSNAPRRNSTAIKQLTNRNIPQNMYDHIMTSGEFCHYNIKNNSVELLQGIGKNCYHLGASKDLCLFENIDITRVTELEQADFILNSGTPGWETDIATFSDFLNQAEKLALPMICANTDMYVPYQGKLALCAGALARQYESIGGTAIYFGKPLSSIYTHLFGIIGTTSNRALMIGDSFETDIRGANAFGIDSLFIRSGLHKQDLDTLTESELANKYNTSPTYAIDALDW